MVVHQPCLQHATALPSPLLTQGGIRPSPAACGARSRRPVRSPCAAGAQIGGAPLGFAGLAGQCQEPAVVCKQLRCTLVLGICNARSAACNGGLTVAWQAGVLLQGLPPGESSSRVTPAVERWLQRFSQAQGIPSNALHTWQCSRSPACAAAVRQAPTPRRPGAAAGRHPRPGLHAIPDHSRSH